MKYHLQYLMNALMIVLAFGCKKPYVPPAVAGKAHYLVVEGIINAGPDSTFIKLSRTVNDTGRVRSSPEINAIVAVQSDQNVSYPLKELGNGNYASAGLNLDNSRKYRLAIKTSNNGQYYSDYMAVLNSPPIDSINFDTKGTVQGPGLNIYVNTHDATNKVAYYRWDYKETWMINSYYPSFFKSNGDTVLGRNLLTDNITDCWQSDTSSTIVLGSTAKLSQDVISNQNIVSYASSSEKLGDEYSILLTQYALTPGAYSFYENLKKNTEQLGSIFDAEPSEIPGNIHSAINPAEPVIGYISVGGTSSRRIFIYNRQLPQWQKDTSFYAGCHLAIELPNFPCCYYSSGQVDLYLNYNKGYAVPYIPINSIGMPGHPPIGYTASTKRCVDCTVRGSNKKPAFWK
jgi:hypothetical protein